MIRGKRLLAAGVVVAVAAGGCGGGESESTATANGQKVVKMASLGVASDAAMMLGREKGFFEEAGIDLQIKQVGAGGAAVAPAVLKGEYDVAGGGIDGALLGASKGLDLKILGSDGAPVSKGTTPPAGAKDFTTGIAVPRDSDIKSVADLANRKMAAITITGLQYLCIAGAAEKAGVQPKQLKILEIPAPEMLPALEAGRVEAAALVEPFITVARQKGMRIIDDPCIEAIPGAVQAGFFTSGRWAEENEDLVAKLSEALVKSNEYADAHPDEVRKVLPTYTKITPELAEKITLAQYGQNDGKNTLPEVAERLKRYGLVEEPPDTNAILTSG